MGVFELGQDVPGLGQRGGDYVLGHLQQVENPGVGHLVEDRGPFFSALDDVGPAQGAEVLGKVRGLKPDAGNQLSDAVFPVTQQLQDLNPDGMSQSAEKFGPDLVDGTGNLFTPPKTSTHRRDQRGLYLSAIFEVVKTIYNLMA